MKQYGNRVALPAETEARVFARLIPSGISALLVLVSIPTGLIFIVPFVFPPIFLSLFLYYALAKSTSIGGNFNGLVYLKADTGEEAKGQFLLRLFVAGLFESVTLGLGVISYFFNLRDGQHWLDRAMGTVCVVRDSVQPAAGAGYAPMQALAAAPQPGVMPVRMMQLPPAAPSSAPPQPAPFGASVPARPAFRQPPAPPAPPCADVPAPAFPPPPLPPAPPRAEAPEPWAPFSSPAFERPAAPEQPVAPPSAPPAAAPAPAAPPASNPWALPQASSAPSTAAPDAPGFAPPGQSEISAAPSAPPAASVPPPPFAAPPAEKADDPIPAPAPPQGLGMLNDETELDPSLAAPAVAVVLDDGRRIGLETPVVLGRNPVAPAGATGALCIPLVDETMRLSKTHLVLRADDGEVKVADLGAKNGVVLEHGGTKERLAPDQTYVLPPDAVLHFGARSLRVSV
ncbi:MAG: FHA domain-containing protein [Nigerium sp.]|nr:FHA domain-containing protein [Nigerium sp.]